jgi:hypothetical protein
MKSRPTSLLNVFFRWATSRNRYRPRSAADHAGELLEAIRGARLAISRLLRCSATSPAPCLKSVLPQNGWSSKSFFIAVAPNAL